jgi:neurotransmitter:Na+ symporter, NSS family
MAAEDFTREKWATRTGFILAAVGSAVGLGNIWRFPFQVGQEGGAAFLIVYLILIVAIGLPAILVEFIIGRSSERNPYNAFKQLGYPAWRFIGALAVTTAFITLTYYSVVAGWVIRYTGASLTGSYFADPEGYFLSVAMGFDAVALHLVFMLATAIVVAFGIQRGIELAVKLLVPSLVIILVGLIVYALTLPGAGEGLAYYLSPEPGVIAENWTTILPAALGQALFTLSIGSGIMITYGSYLAEDRNLGEDGGWIVGLDTIIAFMAGLIIFPVLFTIGITPGEGGAGELFIGVGGAIAGIPGSRIVGFLFFGVVLIGALSSSISIMEVVVSFLMDNFGLERKVATFGIAAVIFVVGLPTAFNIETLELYDGIVGELLLPLGMFLMVIFVGWVFKESTDELAKGLKSTATDTIPVVWLWHVRTVILFLLAVVVALGTLELAGQLF